jgi:CRP-like cAMP-binding protein
MEDSLRQSHNTQLEEIGIGSAFKETLCQMLEATVLFRDFSRQEIETVVRYVHAYRAKPGTALYIEGERNNALALVVRGKVQVHKQTGEGQSRHLATIRPGSVLGEISVIDGFPHSATATTSEETELVMLTRQNLQRIAEEFPKLGARILWQVAWQLCARLRQTSGVLIDYLN